VLWAGTGPPARDGSLGVELAVTNLTWSWRLVRRGVGSLGVNRYRRAVTDGAHRREVVSGDGFVTLGDGSQRWGRFGAAGLLARYRDEDGSPWYFVARRSVHTHRGGTWSVPGGALHSGESPAEGALREFAEEVGLPLGEHVVATIHEDDHGGWTYWTLVVDVPARFDVSGPLGWETAEARWVSTIELAKLDLYDAFRSTLERLGVL
jgi:8-oxo-dGTP diphosphatase